MVVVAQSPFICQKKHINTKRYRAEREMRPSSSLTLKQNLYLIIKTTIKHSQPSNSYSFLLNSLCAQRNRDDIETVRPNQPSH